MDIDQVLANFTKQELQWVANTVKSMMRGESDEHFIGVEQGLAVLSTERFVTLVDSIQPNWVSLLDDEFAELFALWNNKVVGSRDDSASHLSTEESRSVDIVRSELVKTVCINVTQNCNLSCPYCYASASSFDSPETPISMNAINGILNSLQGSTNDQSAVFLTGGEPLLVPNLVEIIRLITERGYPVNLVSNGTLINERFVVEAKQAGLGIVRVSLDGETEEVHGRTRGRSFSSVIRGVKILQKHDVPVSVAMTVTADNYMHIEATRLLAENLGCGFSYAMSLPIGRGMYHKEVLPSRADVLEVLSPELLVRDGLERLANARGNSKCTCGLGGASISFDASGNVHPCNSLVSNENYLGNALWASTREILNSPKAASLRVHYNSLDLCKDCPLATLCGGHCRALETKEGDVNVALQNLCGMRKPELIAGLLADGVLAIKRRKGGYRGVS